MRDATLPHAIAAQVLQRQGVSHPFRRHYRCEVLVPRLRLPARGDDVFLRRYDDGDTDKNLKPKHVKALDAGSDSDGSARKKRRYRSRSRSRSRSRGRSPKRGRKKLREGDKVQAHFRGKSSAKLF